jgi:acyl carrier protein
LTDTTTLKAGPTSEHEAVFKAIKAFLEERAGAGFEGPVGWDTPLMSSNLDSLSVLQLMMFLSDELQFELQEDDFVEEHFGTVGALVARIVARRAAA